jgi:hypothetical protein
VKALVVEEHRPIENYVFDAKEALYTVRDRKVVGKVAIRMREWDCAGPGAARADNRPKGPVATRWRRGCLIHVNPCRNRPCRFMA